jgi:hypothetical protein
LRTRESKIGWDRLPVAWNTVMAKKIKVLVGQVRQMMRRKVRPNSTVSASLIKQRVTGEAPKYSSTVMIRETVRQPASRP